MLERLGSAGVEFEAVPDLCELAARRDPALAAIAASGDAVIIACYPRAVRWLFAYAGAPLAEAAEVHNMRTESAVAIAARVLGGSVSVGDRKSEIARPQSAWIPWFPVLDRERCTNCQQCYNFCLFGVYALAPDGTVEVRNPANCKTNCPACARICPQVAVIFPKYPKSPIPGDEVRPEHLEGKEVRVDPKALAEGDVYAKLRQRTRRFTRPEEAADDVTDGLSLADGQKLCACMADELQKKLGIPPEVLKTLSLAEIKARLQAAAGSADHHE